MIRVMGLLRLHCGRTSGWCKPFTPKTNYIKNCSPSPVLSPELVHILSKYYYTPSTMLRLLLITRLLLALPTVSANSLSPRQSCSSESASYCSSSSSGDSGSSGVSAAGWIADAGTLTGLYNGESYIKRSLQIRQDDDSLCCASGTECGLLGDDNIPLCYVGPPLINIYISFS